MSGSSGRQATAPSHHSSVQANLSIFVNPLFLSMQLLVKGFVVLIPGSRPNSGGKRTVFQLCFSASRCYIPSVHVEPIAAHA
eukprot:1185862-Amphidinium_carterae.1